MSRLGEINVGEILTHRPTRRRWRVVSMTPTHCRLELFAPRGDEDCIRVEPHAKVLKQWRDYRKGDE